jgi:hypothetical protein
MVKWLNTKSKFMAFASITDVVGVMDLFYCSVSLFDHFEGK